MLARACIFAVLCAAVLALAIMSNRSVTEIASNSTRIEMLYEPANVRSLIASVRSGKHDTAPFNESDLIPPFLHFRAVMEVAAKYHLSSCIIEKVMSTTVDAIFCYLTNTTSFTARHRTISTEKYKARFCRNRNRRYGYENMESELGYPRVQFVTIRHPLQRFLSGFAEKCKRKAFIRRICLMCDNLSCFLEKLYDHLNAYYINSTKSSPRFVYDEYEYTVAHFAPQNWYCNFYNHFDDYIILRQGENRKDVMEYAQELETILSKAGVDDCHRKEIHRQLLSEQKFIIRYIDDCFIICATRAEIDECFELMNRQSEYIRLTRKKPNNAWLPCRFFCETFHPCEYTDLTSKSF